jgi:hypothetical protein
MSDLLSATATAPAPAVAVEEDGWAHRVETWAGTAQSTARSEDRKDVPMPIDGFDPMSGFDPTNGWMPDPAKGWMPDPERMTEAAESLLQACRMIYEAYADAYRQALGPATAPKSMTMPGAFDMQGFGFPDEIREAGKQFGLAYIEAADSCISAARKMLT